MATCRPSSSGAGSSSAADDRVVTAITGGDNTPLHMRGCQGIDLASRTLVSESQVGQTGRWLLVVVGRQLRVQFSEFCAVSLHP